MIVSPHAMDQHPLRREVLDELHARPFEPAATPRRLLHLAFATRDTPVAAERAALTEWSRLTGAPAPEEGANFHVARLAGPRLRWERHSEFSTYGWDVGLTAADPFHWPLAEPPPLGEGVATPGPVLVAVDLALIDESHRPADLTALFDARSLCASVVLGGAAEVYADFRQDARGFTRILVMDRGLTPAAAGALVQRLLEIETYRTFALLGLPEAQRLAPVIGRIEAKLVETSARMRDASGLETNAALLDILVSLASELEAEGATASYRFGATRAYDALVRARLQALLEAPLGDGPTITAFLDRRMAPAVRTCQNAADRQAELAGKLERAAHLLRTRVDIAMERQNKALLETMSDRARLQLRLQQTVEGLSVAAVSYYVLGLAGYAFSGAAKAGLWPFDYQVSTAAALPLVVLGVALLVRRIRKSHEGR